MEGVLEESLALSQTTAATANTAAVSIVIPCLNEAETISAVVANAHSALDIIKKKYRLTGEVIVADNGSSDGSIENAQRAGAYVESVTRKGYGSAIRGGVSRANGQFIIMGDADGAHDFHDAVPMIGRLLSGDDLCMGSRFKGHISKGSMPYLNRYLGNPLLTGILNVLFRSGMSDAHCGLRAFTRDAFDTLRLNSSGMEFASEILIKSSLLKLKCSEVPITQHTDGRGRPPHLRPFRDGWRHLKYMLLLAPTWVFLGPSLVFAILGVYFYVLLLSVESGITQEFLGGTFGDHWIIVASSCLSFSHTLFLGGCASYLYSIGRGYRRFSGKAALLWRFCKFEWMILQSALVFTFALFLITFIFNEWSVKNFQNLNAIRPLSLAGALILIGFQHFSSAFLVNIINEKN